MASVVARSLILSIVLVATAPYAQVAVQRQCAPDRACVEAVAFQSKLVGSALNYNVVLPPGYSSAESASVRYPVIYLLHGLMGSAGDWISERSHLVDYASKYRFIIVVPEGRDGWYTDSATVPTDKFETYFLEELIPDVDRRFRTNPKREARAIAGLSMGGYGALKFGLKHPERFSFAASMSGAVKWAGWVPDEQLPGFARASLARSFGGRESPVRAANDLFVITRAVTSDRISALPYLYVDCGTEDFLIEHNREYSALLLQKKIPHEYHQVGGDHSWPYWDRQVRDILRIASERLATK